MRVRKRWQNAHFEVNYSFNSWSSWLTWLLWSTALILPTSQMYELTIQPHRWRELNNLSNNRKMFTWGQKIQRKKHFLSHLMQFLSVLLKPLKRSSLFECSVYQSASDERVFRSAARSLIKENEWFYCVHERWHEDTEAQHLNDAVREDVMHCVYSDSSRVSLK